MASDIASELAQETWSALQALGGAGRHPVNARGLLLSGEFTAAPVAARLTLAAHMQGNAVAALARFSGLSGRSWWPDCLPDVRGLAVSFGLPEGGRSDIVASSLPRFPVRSPQDLLALLRALRLRPGMAWRLPGFLLCHPYVLRGLPATLRGLARPPASYVAMAYHGLHAFTWVTRYGSRRHVRYRWLPEEVRALSWPAAFRRGIRYLEDELRGRLERGTVRMHLQVQVARPGDPLGNPALPWPAGRDVITVGTLELQALAAGVGEFAFDPLRLCPGIQPGPDPLLRLRHELHVLSEAEPLLPERGVAQGPAPVSG